MTAALTSLLTEARDYAANARAANTRKAYRSDWQHFAGWCDGHERCPLPADPETVALYLTDLARSHSPATLRRRVVAISQAHQAAGLDTPTKAAPVRAVMSGIRRAKGTAQQGKRPVLVPDLAAMVERLEALPMRPLAVRDRALLLLGFAGAFRRSELVALDWTDLEFSRDGLTVTIRRSKTDQEGEGRKIGIPYGSNPATCPVRACEAWREMVSGGSVFRPIDRAGVIGAGRLSDRAVARAVKRGIRLAGGDPADYSGHSLRAGLATAAAIGGASERSIMAQTGHRSVQTVRRYIRDGSLFRENAAAKTGL